MHLLTLLPLFLLPLTNASPATTHHLQKRYYSASFMSRILPHYRVSMTAAPLCNGEYCPVETMEQQMCTHMRDPIYESLAFPPDPTEKDSNATTVEMWVYTPPVDKRCAELFGVRDVYGVGPKREAEEKAKWGFAGFEETKEQLLKKVGVLTGWEEKKVRRMLDIVAPGWEEEGGEEEFRNSSGGMQVQDRENPFRLPDGISVRVLPPGPVQELVLTCSAWEIAKRGDTCTKMAHRHGVSRQQFLYRNPAILDKAELEKGNEICAHLWHGFAYCVDGVSSRLPVRI